MYLFPNINFLDSINRPARVTNYIGQQALQISHKHEADNEL